MAITLLIHGGAGTIIETRRDAYRAGLQAALDAGFHQLTEGGHALDAVIRAVTVMEDNPEAFNAGCGGSPNRDGQVECDAAVMNGADLSCGAVAALTRAKNPILIADKVRTKSPHVLLSGAGADALVENPIDHETLLTPYTRDAWQRWREKKGLPTGSATVGAVALDQDGNLAAATSTGGTLGKWPGRIGDSPLIGAGTYADQHIAVSCTGKGEAFMRAVTAKSLALKLRHGQAFNAAIRSELDMLTALEGDGGLIALSREGRVCVGFNTAQMAYAWKTESTEVAKVGTEPGLDHP